MIRTGLTAALLAITVTLTAAPPAHAAGEALIGLTDIGQAGWARDRMVRETLEETLGFDTVRLAIDATPAELPEQVRAFLTRDGAPGDRRFVWISGPGPGNGAASPCPAPDETAVAPRTAALIVAPDCYAEFIALPPGALHIALRDAGASAGHAPAPSEAPPVVLVTLPSDSPAAIRHADTIVLDVLRAAAGGAVTPAALLQRLRYELRLDGSDYTPSLDASSGDAPWSRRFLTPPRPAAAQPWRPIGPVAFEGRLAWPRAGRLDLFATADAKEPPVVALPGGRSVTVLRNGADGSTGFVRAPGALFGWVKLDALD